LSTRLGSNSYSGSWWVNSLKMEKIVPRIAREHHFCVTLVMM
jgi:hypothetical protein